jgi:uncharacterized protein YbcI
VIAAISEGLVALLEEFYGRAPTRMKSYYEDDLVVCVHGGGFSRAELTLLDGGHGSAAIQQRTEIQQRKRDRFQAVIERATGRRVIAFMTGNQDNPEMMSELFILAPTDLLDDQPTLRPDSPADSASVPAPGLAQPSAVHASRQIAAFGAARADWTDTHGRSPA